MIIRYVGPRSIFVLCMRCVESVLPNLEETKSYSRNFRLIENVENQRSRSSCHDLRDGSQMEIPMNLIYFLAFLSGKW